MNDTLTQPETRAARPAQPQNEAAQQHHQRGFLYPQVNIIENKDGYVLEAEMPGVGKDGLEVLLEGNELTLIGRRTFDAKDAQLIYRESAPRDFKRAFVLDPVIDSARISAKIENGVLTLTLPKAEQVKPRKITVGD